MCLAEVVLRVALVPIYDLRDGGAQSGEIQGKSSYKIGEKQFRRIHFRGLAKKVFIAGTYFRGRTNLVPGHFSFTSGVQQNMKAKHPGNKVG